MDYPSFSQEERQRALRELQQGMKLLEEQVDGGNTTLHGHALLLLLLSVHTQDDMQNDCGPVF